MVSEARAQKVAERIHKDLAELLQFEVNDPRLQMLTVTDVEVDRELAFATVYVTSFGESGQAESILSALDGAKGFLRRELARKIRLRKFPALRFRWDDSPDRGARIDELLDMLEDESGTLEGDPEA
jgi:ribosome-binding factor A